MDAATWDVLSIIGTVAFAASGAIVAMEEHYDVFGMFVLGFVTSFGGGMIRDLLLGVPMRQFWDQGMLFETALATLVVLVFLPQSWIQNSKQWILCMDALGLSAFSIQGATFATSGHFSLSAIVVGTVMTGVGGGMLRDVFAVRKPLVLREEIYAVWATLVGVLVGLRWVPMNVSWALYTLFAIIFILRMASIRYRWKFPRKHWFDSNHHRDVTIGQ